MKKAITRFSLRTFSFPIEDQVNCSKLTVDKDAPPSVTNKKKCEQLKKKTLSATTASDSQIAHNLFA